jgi:DNA-binding CsgD family transcriptional regulator/tetratricopeptide (TPR) repeat protein
MLLERATPLQALADYAAEALAGDGRLVLISGEAGIGKSALVEHLKDSLPAARWAWAACDGLFTPRPLGPVFDLAAPLGGELADLCRAHASREELFDALLRQISAPDGLDVIVIEDMHWADEATIDLLRFLGRRIRSAQVLLIATYRDDGLGASDPLRITLGELGSQRSTRRIGLAPLSADAVRLIAAGSGIDAGELYRLTAGNPFYVTEVVRQGTGTGAVPPSARDAVLARAAHLGTGARDVLDVAAMIGTRIEVAVLQSSACCEAADIDELVASGLLTGDGTWLRFRHEIARLAVEGEVARHRQPAIHDRVLSALAAGGCEDHARMAFHAEGAGNGPAVLIYAPAAAASAAELASHREAAAQFERALRFTAGLDAAARASLHDALAGQDALIDRWEEAASAAESALELWREAGDRLREGAAMRLLAYTMWRLCRGDEADAYSEAAVAVLEPLGPTSELGWALSSLGIGRAQNYQSMEALALVRRAQEIAENLGDLRLSSETLSTQGGILFDLGGDWPGPLKQALELATSAGLEEQAGRAYANLYTNHCIAKRFAEAEQFYIDGTAYCDEHDVAAYGRCLRGEHAAALERTGDWPAAISLSEQLLSENTASLVNRLNPLLSLGKILARQGNRSAWTYLDEAAGLTDSLGEPPWAIPARLARAEAFWHRGDLDAARREAELADDVCSHAGPWERGEVAVWLRRTGSARPARGSLAGPYQLEVDGEWRQCSASWAGLGCQFESGMALLCSDEPAGLRQALQLFTDLGAAATAGLTRRKLRELGVRSIPVGPRTATRTDPLGLTRREREVLALLCGGHTNAEIARRLFVAVKTVDHHVSAVLTKLNAPTRDAAAAQASRLGLVKPG